MIKDKDRVLPNPTYMSEGQVAKYLEELRANRQNRPNGSRPPPPSRLGTLRRNQTDAVEVSSVPIDRPQLPTSNSMPNIPAIRPAGTLSHPRTNSSGLTTRPFAGRPIARQPSPTEAQTTVASPTEQRPGLVRTPSMVYRESGQRWMEKQEAHSLRMALEDMDLQDEQKIHSAAQDEAAALVWKHQNPDARYQNPDAPRKYREHLRKGSYTRSLSQEAVKFDAIRSASRTSNRDCIDMDTSADRPSMDIERQDSIPKAKARTPSGKSYGGLAEAVASDVAKARRRVSSGSKRIASGEKKLFMHPNDRIFEDPTGEATPPKGAVFPPPQQEAPRPTATPAYVRKNPFARVRMAHEKLERSNSAPVLTTASTRVDPIEIQKNPPTQTRNPLYVANEPLPPSPPRSSVGNQDKLDEPSTPTKDGKEIRSDDIRCATSMKRSDRSPKLPQPTIVSDKPGRPIVSFKPDWKPKEVVMQEVHAAALPPATAEPFKVARVSESPSRPFLPPTRAQTTPIPQIHGGEKPKPPIPILSIPDAPSIPTLVLPEEPDVCSGSISTTSAPTICIEPPSISVSEADGSATSKSARAQRPLPTPSRSPAGRPLPRHAVTAPLPTAGRPHYTPSIRQSGALCAHCALPIAGRILSAAGERFHPSCFKCHQCATNLECVAFYPEPEKQRTERIERIQARQTGAEVPGTENMTDDEVAQKEYDDGDEGLRFYCHLDFHETFSPRCKSCKTPIEGEVIVACGAEWHAGHFFCAQCGDPFDAKMPFVEKDGYAWCVNCHTNRYSSKCRKCKKPVTDIVVKALGADWHGGCFCCVVSGSKVERVRCCDGKLMCVLQECNGEFEDGKYFLRGDSQDPVCVRCEERRLKA